MDGIVNSRVARKQNLAVVSIETIPQTTPHDTVDRKYIVTNPLLEEPLEQGD